MNSNSQKRTAFIYLRLVADTRIYSKHCGRLRSHCKRAKTQRLYIAWSLVSAIRFNNKNDGNTD